jgi:hypothetical protein
VNEDSEDTDTEVGKEVNMEGFKILILSACKRRGGNKTMLGLIILLGDSIAGKSS